MLLPQHHHEVVKRQVMIRYESSWLQNLPTKREHELLIPLAAVV
jgi:hypothetical protein